MTQPQQVDLPDHLMEGIRRIARDDTMASADRVACVILAVIGYALYEREQSIDTSAIKIPESQWFEIAELLRSGVPEDGLSGTNLALTWLNQGPSCYHVQVTGVPA